MSLLDVLAELAPRGLFGASARSSGPLSGDYGNSPPNPPPQDNTPLSNDYGMTPPGGPVLTHTHTVLFPNGYGASTASAPRVPAPIPVQQDMGDGRPHGWGEKLRVLGAGLQDVSAAARGQQSDNADRTMAMIQAAQQRRAQQAAQQDIADFAAGRPIQPRAQMVSAMEAAQGVTPDAPADPNAAPPAQAAPVSLDGVSLHDPSSAIAAPHIEAPAPVALPARSPMADKMGQPVTLANALPFLMHAQSLGIDTGPYVEALKAAAPAPHQHVEGPNGLYDFDPATNSYKLIAAKPKEPVKLGKDDSLYMPDDPNAPPPAAPGPPQAAATTAAPTGGIYSQVADVAQRNGADPAEIAYLQRLAKVESSGNPAAQNGQSTGLFQFHPTTFAQLGGHDIHSVPEQTAAALAMSRRDRQTLQTMGVDPTDANTYVLHQQGASGGPALLAAEKANPNASAVSVLSPIYGGSADIARRAVVANGGQPDMTAAQFAAHVRSQFGAPDSQPSLAGGAASDTLPQQIPGYHLVHQAAKEADGSLEPALQGLTDNDLISKLQPAEATQVKALAEGRMPFPSSFAISKPYWQRMLQLVSQYDPTFNGSDYQSRAKTRADFTSGKSAQNITALNTVIGHLDDLDKSIDGLGNYGIPLNNFLAHKIAGATGTDARIKTFQTAKTAVANELTRVFRGTGGAEADIKQWQSQLDDASSPEALRAVVHSMAGLINSRIEALGEQYNQGMSLTQDPLRLLTPDKAAAFARMSAGVGPHDPEAKNFTPAAIGATVASGPPGRAPSSTANAPRVAATKVYRYDANGNRVP